MSTLKILIADDHELFRRSLRSLVESQPGWTVCGEAGDGREAVEKTKELRPDVVLLDVSMPEMNGLDAARLIRRDIPESKILMISQNEAELMHKAARQVGADGFVHKSNISQELFNKVESVSAKGPIEDTDVSDLRGSTARSRAEQQRKLLVQTEVERARLHELFLQLPAAICLLQGPEHRYTFVNREYLKVTGRRQFDEFVGKTVYEALPEFAGQPFLDLLDQVFRTGVSHVGNAAKVAFNGGVAYHNFIYQPLRGTSGQVEGILVHVVDVTEQVLARERIEARERQFREIIDHLPAAIYTTDAEGRLTHFNSAAVEFSGRVPQLGTDQWCVTWKLFRPDGSPLPHDECPMAIALKEGRVLEGVEAIAERPDGTRRWFTPYPTPLRDEQGKIIGGVNMLVDITERKQAERATSQLAAIVDSSDDAIVSKNLDGIINSWNKAAERMFGYTAKEAIGRHITLIIPRDRWGEEDMILSRIRRGEPIDHFETVRIRKDGSLLDLSVTISPIRDATGRVIGASKVARDISERKRADEALRKSEEKFRRLSETLDLEVRTRTRELEDRNAAVLRQSELLRDLSRRLLQAQDEERRRIARELHDSAGQTLTVLGMCLARVAQQSPSSAPALTNTLREAEQLVQQLHQEIRTMSYLLHPPLLDETGLGPALTWYIEGLRSRSGIEISLNVSQDLGRLPREMELAAFRVVQESLTNIHRHSGSKTAAITIERTPVAITIEVRDQGKGIPPKKLTEIQSRGGGVGIRGIRERVQQLEGDLTIDSNKNGTRVFVTIPLAKTASVEEPNAVASIQAAV